MAKITLAHGGGGQKTSELIRDVFHKYFRDPVIRQLDDGALLKDLVLTTDSFVVKPLFFPGGDIGKLAVCGAVNDLAVMGAEPLYLAISFIIEEGFEIDLLEKIAWSAAKTAEDCQIRIVAADTKVVERGKGDGLYLSTAAIGRPAFARPFSMNRIKPGDRVLVSGSIGEHGMAVALARATLSFQGNVISDVAPLWNLINSFFHCDVKFMRDPTRGGVAQTLHEMVNGREIGITIFEKALPISQAVRSGCDILGFDPLYLANEGKVLAVVSSSDTERVLALMQKNPLGKKARVIGEVTAKNRGRVVVQTLLNTERILLPPVGEILPRIC